MPNNDDNKTNSMYKRSHSFRINIVLEVFKIISCIEILADLTEIYTIYLLQLIKNYITHILGTFIL